MPIPSRAEVNYERETMSDEDISKAILSGSPALREAFFDACRRRHHGDIAKRLTDLLDDHAYALAWKRRRAGS